MLTISMMTKPNSPYFKYAKRRLGEITGTDAQKAYENYLEPALRSIHFSRATKNARDILEYKVAPDGTDFPWRVYRQFFEDTYVSPNATHDFFFNSIDGPFPSDSRLHVQLMTSTVEYQRMFRWPAWELDVATGQAVPAEPLFYDTD